MGLDFVKGFIAGEVKEAIAKRLDGDVLIGGTELKVTYIDQLNTLIRAKQPSGVGPRYFLVKVSEQL